MALQPCIRIAVGVAVATTIVVPAIAQCPPSPARWREGFNTPGFTGGALYTADIVDDDGPDGPRRPTLYIGGSFTEVGGRVALGIARWNAELPDGAGGRGGWEPLPVPLFAPPATAGNLVRKLAAFDLDGPGPNPTRLIALGTFFTSSPSGTINRAAYLDGNVWRQIPTSSAEPSSDAMALDPDGDGPAQPELFVATTLGVLRWNGASLAATTGAGAPGDTGDSFALFDSDGPGPIGARLYYTSPGPGLVVWNGTSFVPAPSQPGAARLLIITADPDGPGPLPVCLVAVRGGGPSAALPPGTTTWITIPGHTINGSYHLAQALIAGDPDGPGPLPSGLLLSGSASGNPALVSRFDGSTWSHLGPQSTFVNSRALAAFDFDGESGPRPTQIFCGGQGIDIVGAAAVGDAAVWDAGLPTPAWRASIPGGALPVNFTVHGTTVDPDGPGPAPRRLHLAGALNTAGTAATRQIARLELPSPPSAAPLWTSVNPDATLLNNPIGTASFDFDGPGPEGESLVAIRFWTLGLPNLSAPVRYVGRLSPTNPGAWDLIGQFQFRSTSPDGALGVFDPDGDGPAPAELYVAGPFTSIDGVSLNGVARLTAGSTSWQSPAVPWGIGGAINAFATFDDDGPAGPNRPRLHVIANEPGGGGTSVVARMDDDTWTTLGPWVASAGLYALAGFDPDGDSGPMPPRLYRAGHLIGSGLPFPVRVQVWDGAAWSPAGGALGGFAGGEPVRSLVTFDDDGPGPGRPALYAAGDFYRIGNTPIAGGLVKLTDGAWQPVPGTSGAGGPAWVVDPDGEGPRPAYLVYRGRTVARSGVFSTGIGVLEVPAAPADFNEDWLISLADVLDFLAAYFAGDPRADLNASGAADVGDLFRYLHAYFGGCP